MRLSPAAAGLAERAPLPDLVTRRAIAWRVARARHALARAADRTETDFAAAMAHEPIARDAASANAQHYELPPEFFALVLGPRRKYSCCLYDESAKTLAAAEDRALAETALHAGLADGQHILELGCGWGSLALWLAERLPRARITAVSNARPQRRAIEDVAAVRGLANLRVVTADINDFDPGARFDRIVSVEMFEHVANWPALLARTRDWLLPEGQLFLHVFSHRRTPYRFDAENPQDWIAQHFFTGGIMPSHGLIRHFASLFEVEAEWRWSGLNYQRTARDWLANYDARGIEIDPILRRIYGAEWAVWKRRWRLFFLATAELFGAYGGEEWGVSHYRLRPLAGA
jgi:cyclopropane-fatty-acyl-phospholipid synthase